MTSASLPTSSEQGGAPTRPARRTVMAAAGAAGLAAALTACGSGDDSSDSVVTGAGSAQEGGGSAGGAALARTADIPEGGGKIFKDQGVVVTQPTAGTYKAFSAKCTHQGCAVGSVADGVIVCPCHGSHFSAEDGSVKKGPATQPLAAKKISVSGDEIELA
ncbi:Rieske (2Fe-2S) protein [Streptomyces echinatus]|uniref:Cytochrome bc1 complex Rieske iron-sulfur subunit n=1 Tax=Streptomyces echinatus TaxID=67293 RepID=A0A7W9PS43_9ACTN|nr:Rieske (2Fe-2S) protein [Streptomyces echinatus]MBB5926242.1 Rieske Fe-S protein [Streptomyces echinatus]